MIVAFHSLCFLLQRFVKHYRVTKAIDYFQNSDLLLGVTTHIRCILTDNFDVFFDPPAFKQRCGTVQQILLNPSWKLDIKKVVVLDRELNFFSDIKYLYDIQEIICVNIDEDALKSQLYRLHPSHADYFRRRPTCLKVRALSGSPSQPDERLARCDAVIAIEMIQELYPDTLEGLPYNVFHYIQPLLAIITVPNADFNVPLPYRKKLQLDSHKFEWTREQFQTWALNITARFPNYTVRFHGICEGPENMESFGCFTQAAIFFRHSERTQPISKSWSDDNESYGICTYYAYVKQSEPHFDVNNLANYYYKELECFEYPYENDNRTPDERILAHVQERLYYATTDACQFYNEETKKNEYPLYRLISNENTCFTSVPELSRILKKKGYKIEDRDDFYLSRKTPCIIYSPTEESKKVEYKDTTSQESDLEIECGEAAELHGESLDFDKTDQDNPNWNKPWIVTDEEEVEGWKAEEVEGWKAEEVEGWKAEEAEGWKAEEAEGWKAEEVEGWKAEEVEGWKAEEAEGWKAEEVEGWKAEEVEGWKAGEVEDYEAKEYAEELEDFKTEEEAKDFAAQEKAKDFKTEEEAKNLEAEGEAKNLEAEEEARELKSDEKVQDSETKVETEDIEAKDTEAGEAEIEG